MTEDSATHISRHATQDDYPDDMGAEKIQAQQVEAAAHELNRIDIDKLARDSLTWKSRATVRLLQCVLVQGLSKMHPSSGEPPTNLVHSK